MIRIAIYEPNEESAGMLETKLQYLFHKELHILVYQTMAALEDYVYRARMGNVDILFVSLNSGEPDLLERVAAIQDDFLGIQLTFLIESEEQALHIFKADPTYLIKKPVSQYQVQEAMNRMLIRLKRDRRNVLIFESEMGIQFLHKDEILYLESDRKEVTVFMTRDRQVTGVYKLDEIEEQLEEGFIRCHQSYLVNADRVKCVTAKEVILHNDKAIPISRNRGKETKTALYSYIRSAVALGGLIADNAEIFTFL